MRSRSMPRGFGTILLLNWVGAVRADAVACVS